MDKPIPKRLSKLEQQIFNALVQLSMANTKQLWPYHIVFCSIFEERHLVHSYMGRRLVQERIAYKIPLPFRPVKALSSYHFSRAMVRLVARGIVTEHFSVQESEPYLYSVSLPHE